VVLVDVEPKVALERIASRGEGTDLFETLDALTRVRKVFLELAAEPHFARVDGSAAPDDVFAALLDVVRSRLDV
jgi:thymidylate kinase